MKLSDLKNKIRETHANIRNLAVNIKEEEFVKKFDDKILNLYEQKNLEEDEVKISLINKEIVKLNESKTRELNQVRNSAKIGIDRQVKDKIQSTSIEDDAFKQFLKDIYNV